MKSKIRIMHLINSFSLAGAEKLVYDICKRIDKNKFEVYICSIGYQNTAMEKHIINELEHEDIHTTTLKKEKNKKRIRTIFELRKIILENKIDIINTHCTSPDFYGRTAAFFSNLKIVFSTVHNTKGYSGKNERIYKYITTKYIAISDTVKEYIVNELKISNKKVEIIYNGIDKHLLSSVRCDRNSKLRELKVDPEKFVVLNIGRVEYQKGQIYLVEAARELMLKFANIHFVIVGNTNLDHKCYNEIKELIDNYSLNEYFTFTGIRKDIPEILNASDIFVFPSLYEGFSLTVMEALACGKPVVATDVGSIREIIVDGKNGTIIPPMNPNAIADSLYKFMSDNNYFEKISYNAYSSFSNKFTIEKTLESYKNLYMEHYNKIRTKTAYKI
jgi:glycosyltransferase involved in cell wall biosynthesis